MFKNVLNVLEDTGNDYGFSSITLDEAVNSPEYNEPNKQVVLRDRGNAVFTTVLSNTVQANSYTIIQSLAVPSIAFVLMSTGRVNVRYIGITGLGTVNDSPAFQFLIDKEIPTSGNAGDKYYMQTRISVLDKAVDFDMDGALFIEDSDRGQTFHFRNGLQNQVPVTALGSVVVKRTTLTTLTLANSTAYGVGDVIKIACDDRIRPDAHSPRDEFKAEFAVVTAKEGSTLTLDTQLVLINSGSTNIQVAQMVKRKFRFANSVFSLRTERSSYAFPYHIACEGYIVPQFFNLKAESGAGIFIRTLSCYGAMGKTITADNLLDDTSKGKIGYGVAEYGSQYSNWYDLNIGRCRHAYTTGSDEIDAPGEVSIIGYGGAVRCNVWSGVCVGATNFAWDTHNDSFECVFHNVVAVGNRQAHTGILAGGFQDRGVNTVLHTLTYHGNSNLGDAGPDIPVYYGQDSKNCLINKIQAYGDNLKLTNNANVSDSSFFIKEMDIVSNTLSSEVLDFTTHGTVRVQKFNYHLRGNINLPDTSLSAIDLNESGLFYLDEFNIFADEAGTQVVNIKDYTLIRVDSPNHKGVFANINIYCGDASSLESIANSRVLNCGGNKIFSGNINVNIYAPLTPPDRRKELIFNPGEGTNVTYSLKVHTGIPDRDSKYDSFVGNIFLASPTNILHFGPNGYPWNQLSNRSNHQKLVKYIISNNDARRIIEVMKPSFNGQELMLVVPANSDNFVIIGDCPGMHTAWSSSDVVFTGGKCYHFISRWDEVEEEYLWDYLPA